jgi:hypothetical protein
LPVIASPTCPVTSTVRRPDAEIRISSGAWVRWHTAQLPSMDRVTEPSGLTVMFSGISPAA